MLRRQTNTGKATSKKRDNFYNIISHLNLLIEPIFLQVEAAEVKEPIRSRLGQSPNAVQYGEIVRAGELSGIVKGDGR